MLAEVCIEAVHSREVATALVALEWFFEGVILGVGEQPVGPRKCRVAAEAHMPLIRQRIIGRWRYESTLAHKCRLISIILRAPVPSLGVLGLGVLGKRGGAMRGSRVQLRVWLSVDRCQEHATAHVATGVGGQVQAVKKGKVADGTLALGDLLGQAVALLANHNHVGQVQKGRSNFMSLDSVGQSGVRRLQSSA